MNHLLVAVTILAFSTGCHGAIPKQDDLRMLPVKAAPKTSAPEAEPVAVELHDGSQKTLEEVVEFYNKGGEPNPDQEKADLVEFMKALDGDPYPTAAQPPLPQ